MYGGTMPRSARKKKSTEGIYHITERGNEGNDIFRDEEDRSQFLDIVRRNQKKYGFQVYAYCLMTNHLHLLLGSQGADISQVMKSINVSYVIYFNRKYRRSGHLFQDRFHSELVDEDSYLVEVSRYIHLNPVRANMVNGTAIHEYPWCSYRQYVLPELQEGLLIDRSFILGLFAPNLAVAQKQYQEYVMRDDDIDFRCITASDTVVHLAIGRMQEKERAKNSHKDELPELAQEMAAEYGVDWESMITRENNHIDIRNRIIRKIRQHSQTTLKEIGSLFGLSESMVSKILKVE
jgi:REP element-mobilizing transposase RayT